MVCHVSIIYKLRAEKVWRVFLFLIITTAFVVLIFYFSFAFYSLKLYHIVKE